MSLKTLFSYIIKYLLSLVFFFFITSSILLFHLANPKYMVHLITEQKYINYLDTSIKEEMKNYTLSSGLKEEVLEDIYKKEELEQEIYFQIQNIIKKDTIEINTLNLRNHLEENINNYLNQNNLIIESKEKERFISQIESVYKKEITLYGYLDTLKIYLQKMNEILKITIWTSFFLFVFLYLIQNIILKEASLVTPFFTASLLMIAIIIFINCNIDKNHINIFNPNYSKLLTKAIEDILCFFQNTSMILILSAIFIPILFEIILKRTIKQKPRT